MALAPPRTTSHHPGGRRVLPRWPARAAARVGGAPFGLLGIGPWLAPPARPTAKRFDGSPRAGAPQRLRDPPWHPFDGDPRNIPTSQRREASTGALVSACCSGDDARAIYLWWSRRGPRLGRQRRPSARKWAARLASACCSGDVEWTALLQTKRRWPRFGPRRQPVAWSFDRAPGAGRLGQ